MWRRAWGGSLSCRRVDWGPPEWRLSGQGAPHFREFYLQELNPGFPVWPLEIGTPHASSGGGSCSEREGVLWWLSSKRTATSERCGFTCGVRKVPWSGKWHPPIFLPGNPWFLGVRKVPWVGNAPTHSCQETHGQREPDVSIPLGWKSWHMTQLNHHLLLGRLALEKSYLNCAVTGALINLKEGNTQLQDPDYLVPPEWRKLRCVCETDARVQAHWKTETTMAPKAS